MAPSLRVIIVEKSSKVLSKVKVSGGGRCNVTHACFDIAELARHYPRGQNFLKKAFHWFNPPHTIDWFRNRGVDLKTEQDGRMFPISNSSQTIIDCLINELNQYHVQLLLNKTVIRLEKINGYFHVHYNNGHIIETDYVCVACGGFPKPEQFDWLVKTGHHIELPVPSLFTFNMPGNTITSLMGISVPHATVKIPATKLDETGPLLITHWGFSGPVILKLSAWGARELAAVNYHFSISVNWLYSYNEASLRQEWVPIRKQFSSQKVGNKNPFELPARLWLYLLNICDINQEFRWADVTGIQQNKLIKTLTAQEFAVKGKTTFKEEFVTCGGIKLSEIDVNSMQSKLVTGLFFAGEIMDVDGITGGFNFQHAWTSGWIAAKAIAQMAV